MFECVIDSLYTGFIKRSAFWRIQTKKMKEEITNKRRRKMPLDQIDVDKLEEEKGKETEMSFMDHLEELRWRIIRVLGVIVGLGIILFVCRDWLFDTVILGAFDKDFYSYQVFCVFSDWIGISDFLCFTPPAIDIQAIGFAEPFITSIKVAFIAGFFASFPYVFYQFWKLNAFFRVKI